MSVMGASIDGALLKKLNFILHRGFVEARALARRQVCRQLHDLADAFEILPALIEPWEESHLDRIRGILRQYQEQYPETAYDYLAILQMSDSAFAEIFEATESF